MEGKKEKETIQISLGTFLILVISIGLLLIGIVLGLLKATEASRLEQLETNNNQIIQQANS